MHKSRAEQDISVKARQTGISYCVSEIWFAARFALTVQCVPLLLIETLIKTLAKKATWNRLQPALSLIRKRCKIHKSFCFTLRHSQRALPCIFYFFGFHNSTSVSLHPLPPSEIYGTIAALQRYRGRILLACKHRAGGEMKNDKSQHTHTQKEAYKQSNLQIFGNPTQILSPRWLEESEIVRTGDGSERCRLSSPGRRCWRRGSHAAGVGPGRARCLPEHGALSVAVRLPRKFLYRSARCLRTGSSPRSTRAAAAQLDQGGGYLKHPPVVSIHTVRRLLAAARRVRHPDVDWERTRFSHCLRGEGPLDLI